MPEKRSRPRTCLGCGNKRDKREMVRISRSPEGVVTLDLTGRSPGRGAYICPSCNCLLAARKKRSLEKALGATIDEKVYREIDEYLSASDQDCRDSVEKD